MSIEQTLRGDETIICTRDKDLRSVDGWHYGWELGEQPSFGPFRVDGYGAIHLSDDRKKITGYGLKFFLSQCLTGDRVDSIPGLPKCGPVAAFERLVDTNTYEEGRQAVLEAYSERYGDEDVYELEEQGRLLWMTRKLNEDGTPVLWDVHATY
jgi:5'-3' exonuclease